MNALIGLVLLTQTAQPTPPEVVSQMFRNYALSEARSVRISLSQSAQGVRKNVQTWMQFKRPEKLFIQQAEPDKNLRRHVICDGNTLKYFTPVNMSIGSKEVYEKQGQMTVDDVFRVGTPGLLDRSPVLDIVLGARENLEFVANQWATLEFDSPSKDSDGNFRLKGKYRDYRNAPPHGSFSLVVSPKYALVSYTIRETVAVDNRVRPFEVLSTWTVSQDFPSVTDASVIKVK